MSRLKAIAAMASNRTIGYKNDIPWHLPDDFRWFKQTTLGHILLMGRTTFDSIGRVLPGRETWVLSRSASSLPAPVKVFHRIEDLPLSDHSGDKRTIWVCGGASVYQQLLPHCDELYLTHVHRHVEGDTFFPPFEHLFHLEATLSENQDFSIRHYRKVPAMSAHKPS